MEENPIQAFARRKKEKAQEYLEVIEEMLNDETYSFAWDTLSDIYKWVENAGLITDAQITAVTNIQNSTYA